MQLQSSPPRRRRHRLILCLVVGGMLVGCAGVMADVPDEVEPPPEPLDASVERDEPSLPGRPDAELADVESPDTSVGDAGGARDASADSDASVDASSRPRRVFVTSSVHRGDFGGVAGGDAICQTRATEAGLTGTFKAWLATPTTQVSDGHTRGTGPYVRIDGTVIAADFNAFLNEYAHQVPVNQTEDGAAPPVVTSPCSGEHMVWTGAGASVDLTHTCDGWTNPDASSVILGNADTLQNWAYGCLLGGPAARQPCALRAPLYCVEE